ncbi:MAG: hypothetical protein J0H17_18685 [Rhizobiales bacterium]|nr:hypothetical protein [Hyphomicrobiales bacterium]
MEQNLKIGDFVDVIAPRPAPTDLHWFIVHVLGSDKHALDWLHDKLKFETYYPTTREYRPVAKRFLSPKQRSSGVAIMRPHDVPLFPRYVFMRCDPQRDEWNRVRSLAGVGGFVCKENQAVWVPDALIDNLRSREVAGVIPGKLPASMVFKAGEEVRITDGPFSHFNGTVEETFDKPISEIDPDDRIRIAINIFGRSTALPLTIGQFEKL